MADGIPSTLRIILARLDSVEDALSLASEAQAATLHKLDELLGRGNGRRRKSSRVGKKSPRGAHRNNRL